MDYFFRFFYAPALYALVPLLFLVMVARARYYRGARYRYPLSSSLASAGVTSKHIRDKVLFVLRSFLLVTLMLLVAKPQFIDPRSHVTIEGIDIVLVLDVSASMAHQHHNGDTRSRFAIAQYEAIRFIDKRPNDAIGVVVFGNEAVSRCPLTADKALLKQIIADTELGFIDPEGTVISKGIITAANRLKNSHAKSKIMVVLTDGQPSHNDADPLVASAIAKELGIKIYTIGIGDEQEQMLHNFWYNPSPLNKPLLEAFARETGGMFFEAKNGDDMRHIYDTIDTLEKNKIEAPIFGRHYDWFVPLLWLALLCVLIELFASTCIWFGR